MNIAVYCASSTTLDKKYYEVGEQFGKKMAGRGHGLVYGGYGEGIMGAVAKQLVGKQELIGVIPDIFHTPEMTFDDCTRIIYTDTMSNRKKAMEEASDAFVALPGGIGTYDELFEVYTLKTLGLIDKPIAVLNAYGCYDHLEALLNQNTEEEFLSRRNRSMIRFFSDMDELLDYIEGK